MTLRTVSRNGATDDSTKHEFQNSKWMIYHEKCLFSIDIMANPRVCCRVDCEALGLIPRPLGRKLSLVLPSFSQKRPKYPVCLQRGFFYYQFSPEGLNSTRNDHADGFWWAILKISSARIFGFAKKSSGLSGASTGLVSGLSIIASIIK